ncbi:fibronectin type III domain-containing protein [Butyrivibrio sp. INlla16]|uniref:fibronectin type III domain-containing protein n=1 Tax=Butyrivibrio sp. INlla16 TaxID=1520807 RepID=UPI0008897FCF|nr:fibronectin type III domain-containing protein [Butyrivibrio sp. INlla16]SDB66391.1 hypothetical protein SAMN02910263_03833 [Butyrivibrio sp. INlla16]
MNKIIFRTFSTIIAAFILFSAFPATAYATNSDNSSITLDRNGMLSTTSESYSSDTTIRWDSYRKSKLGVHDGNIPVSMLNDPVYCSMNLPSESVSDMMIAAWRDNGHIVGTIPDSASKLLNFGAIEDTTNTTLPENFSVYIGKMKMFAFSSSQNKWLLIDSQPYPCGIYIYTLPWTTTVATKCTDVSYHGSYAKVNLTREQLQGNCLHFWGKSVPIEKDDYLYYAACYDVWVSSNAVGTLTATGGIDTKDAAGKNTLTQLYSTRGYSCTTTSKSIWGNTIPNSEYTKCNSSVLNQMYSGNMTSSPEVTTPEASTPEVSTPEVSVPEVTDSNNNEEAVAPSQTSEVSNTNTNETENTETQINNNEDTTPDNSNPGLTEEKENTPENNNVDPVTENQSPASNGAEEVKEAAIPTPPTTNITLAIGGYKSIILRWKKQSSNVSGYEIQYSTDKSFKKNVDSVSINKYTKTNKVISKLKSGKTYYVRIRTINKKDNKTANSNWSKKVKVKTW